VIEEDKVTLTRERVELVALLTPQLSVEDRVRIQEELRLVNAKIKALNTTQAAQLKAAADQRKIAGLTEAQANAARAAARVQSKHGSWPSSAPGEPGFGDPINKKSINDRAVTPGDDGDDDDPGQTAAIDGWIDAVLLRNDVTFTRSRNGKLNIVGSPGWAPVIMMLVDGIYAAARGHELPDLPSPPPKTTKVPKKPKKP
jgi:hypothetical protein